MRTNRQLLILDDFHLAATTKSRQCRDVALMRCSLMLLSMLGPLLQLLLEFGPFNLLAFCLLDSSSALFGAFLLLFACFFEFLLHHETFFFLLALLDVSELFKAFK